LQPKWEKVGPFLWRTPVRGGWLCRDIRDSTNYYESDPEKGKINFNEAFTMVGKGAPDAAYIMIDSQSLGGQPQ